MELKKQPNEKWIDEFYPQIKSKPTKKSFWELQKRTNRNERSVSKIHKQKGD